MIYSIVYLIKSQGKGVLRLKTNIDNLSQFFVDTLLLIHNNFFRQTSVPIPLNQFGVLCVLESEKHASISDISHRLKISKQQMTTIIEKLVAANLIEKKPDEHDRRRSIITLTNDGHAIINHQHELEKKLFKKQIAKLYKSEQAQLAKAICDYNRLIDKMFT